MVELLQQVDVWHWLILGLLLLSGEIFGAAGHLLWLGISALLVALLMLLFPMNWQAQWLCFAGFSLSTTWLWWRYQRNRDRQSDAQLQLNQKSKQLIGKTAYLEQDVALNQSFRLRLADSTWLAIADKPLAKGTLVTVVDIDGIKLHVSEVLEQALDELND